MRRSTVVVALAYALVASSMSAYAQGQPTSTPTTASADLRDARGNSVAMADLREEPDQVLITFTFASRGVLTGTHAVHIHERGQCNPPEFTDAGGIFNPLNKQHGLLNTDGPMVGDLPDMVLGPDGLTRYSVAAPLATLRPGPATLLAPNSTSLVIDAGQDDNTSQPSGNSGAHVACGVILAPGQAPPPVAGSGASNGAFPTNAALVVGAIGVVAIVLGLLLRSQHRRDG